MTMTSTLARPSPAAPTGSRFISPAAVGLDVLDAIVWNAFPADDIATNHAEFRNGTRTVHDVPRPTTGKAAEVWDLVVDLVDSGAEVAPCVVGPGFRTGSGLPYRALRHKAEDPTHLWGPQVRTHRLALAFFLGYASVCEMDAAILARTGGRLDVDHGCESSACPIPLHVKLTTCRDNVLRNSGPAAQNARATHCKYGHPLAGDNLVPHLRRSRGSCRRCKAANSTAHQYVNNNTAGLPRSIRAYIVESAVDLVGTLTEPPSGSWSTEGTEAARRIVADCFPDYLKR